jgi:hypothetical protein
MGDDERLVVSVLVHWLDVAPPERDVKRLLMAVGIFKILRSVFLHFVNYLSLGNLHINYQK